MSDVEVDQSGRTDVLTVDTVLALSDDLQRAILIPKFAKRECWARLRAREMRKALVGIRLFSASLVLLLEECVDSLASITIDLEYVGWEGEIKRHVLRKLRERGHKIEKDQIVFRQIGKESPAHKLAWRTLRGYHTPQRYIGVDELMGAC
jgi:hypothetical protein